MIKSLIIIWISFCFVFKTAAQRVVYDQKHFAIVNENAAVRASAELAHNQYLEKIDRNLSAINTNASSVVVAQNIIYNSLANVNSALKNGMAVKDMAAIINDILEYTHQMMSIARSEPYLLLFAEDISRQLQFRSTNLLNDVSGFILNQNNVLADFNSRDQLIRTVTQELQIIAGLVYGAWRAMFWAKQKGVFRSVNPYASYINTDRKMVEEIINNAKYLKK